MGCQQCSRDKKKTDLNDLRKQSENDQNNDAKEIIELIEEEDTEIKDDSLINISSELKYLNIIKIFLGLQSEYNLYEKNKKEIEEKGYSKKDCVHPSLYAFYEKKNGYYIDYQPSDSKANNVTYIYKNKKNGLRYGKKTFKEFVKNNNICIIKLKLKKIQNFYDFFQECCKKGEWTKESFNYYSNNCCDFIIIALEILEAGLKTGDIEKDVLLTNRRENGQSKESFIPTKLLNYFKKDQNETDISD